MCNNTNVYTRKHAVAGTGWVTERLVSICLLSGGLGKTISFYVFAEMHKGVNRIEWMEQGWEKGRCIFYLSTHLSTFFRCICQKALKCRRDGTDRLSHSNGCFDEGATDHLEQYRAVVGQVFSVGVRLYCYWQWLTKCACVCMWKIERYIIIGVGAPS